MPQEFDINQAPADLRSGHDLLGKDGAVLTPLIKQLIQAALKAELDAHLSSRQDPNRKTVKTATGSFELDTPRDRAGMFEPRLFKKYWSWSYPFE